jgi:N-acetylmuramoyl-L-alanine amidase
MHSKLRATLSWVGLLVMAICLVWLESLPRIERRAPPVQARTADVLPLVVLDPGHGGQDSGAICAGVMEKDLTLDVANRVERQLRSAGIATVMTRSGDKYVSLSERAAITNRMRNCILVSIHFNEGNKPVSSGIETYYAEHQVAGGTFLASWLPFLRRVSTDAPNLESQSLAGFIQDALVARTHALNRGTKTEQFFVLANVQHPAVLVEGGFISNKDDANKLGNVDYREQIAAAINDGILHYRDVLNTAAQPASE